MHTPVRQLYLRVLKRLLFSIVHLHSHLTPKLNICLSSQPGRCFIRENTLFLNHIVISR